MINDASMHYELMPAEQARWEPTPVVVFIHGLGTDSLASFYLTLAAPVAAAGIDVIAYDLRGHGRSSLPLRGYRVADFVNDLAGLLDEIPVSTPVHLVGNSFGGTIAFSFAAAFPERVASIVSIEAEPATEEWAAKMVETMDNTMRELRRDEFYVWVANTFGNHHARLTRAAAKRLLSTTMADEVALEPFLDLPGLEAIRCPVLSIVGSDGFQKDDPSLLASVLPDCRTEVLDGQDHSVLVNAHKAVRELLISWVGEHSDARQREPA
jgi:pimeloyl-ACP methyl ester carboxylesterase